MTAGEYCNREVIITEQDASVTEAAVLMRQHHVGDLVVVEKLRNINENRKSSKRVLQKDHTNIH